jgi:hypothetical protein
MIEMLGRILAIRALANALPALKNRQPDSGGDGETLRYPIWATIHQPDSELEGLLENTLPPFVIGAKPGVILKGIDRPVMTKALIAALEALEGAGKRLVVTSGLDGRHMKNSLHYQGRALDIRTRHIPPGERRPVRDRIAEALGDDYDVVLEKTHIHIEYDPA